MNFVTWSIRYPIPVLILFAALMLAGIVSFPKLPVLDKPDIEFPVVTINVTYPGVQAAQLESEVTRKVEDAVAGVIGIRHIRSNISAGSSSSVIEFEFETAPTSPAMPTSRSSRAPPPPAARSSASASPLRPAPRGSARPNYRGSSIRS